MCAQTPIWCPTCGDTLLLSSGRRATCRTGSHTFTTDELPVPTSHRIVGQYHGSGHSQAHQQIPCQHCTTL